MIELLNEFDFHPRIAATPGIALVFFSGPNCASCRHLKALLQAEMSHFRQQLGTLHVYEVRADKSMALVNEFDVFHLPSLFLYRDGRFHCALQSEANPAALIESINNALRQPAQEEP